MRFLFVIISLSFLLNSCSDGDNAPDVSGIKMDLQTRRFEQDLFQIDSTNFAAGYRNLLAKYPSFGENFTSTILNADPKWPVDSVLNYIQSFVSAYRHIYDSSQKIFADFTPYEKEIEKSLKYVRYYFPKYPIPHQVITYIGPMDGYGDILDADVLIVGLHHHLGKEFSLYKTIWVRETYPEYISSRFAPDYITINAMKNILSDLFPEKFDDKDLMVQMVEKGKRLYALKKLVPSADDYQLIGYTKKQLEQSLEREAIIWDLFVQNNFLRSNNYNVIKNYIGDSPKTQELGEAAPGNIGSFSGWQIVKEYMNKKPETSLEKLMTTDAEIIFQEAKYKP
jgi:hypothetical protein